MKIVIAYIVVAGGPITQLMAAKFAATYQAYPTGAEHTLLACCNGGIPETSTALILQSIGAQLYPRSNPPSWDIGAYIELAHGPCADADLMVCLGESCYFQKEGWLNRLMVARNRWGGGMYGFFSSFLKAPHMNTTGFATSPALLREYPWQVNTHADRYEFEHGLHKAFWRYVRKRGMATKFVTWDGEYDPYLWRVPANILWRGDQSNLLVHCNHTDRYDMSPLETRQNWSRGADSPPRENLRSA